MKAKVAILSLVLLVAASFVSAAEFMVGKEGDANVSTSATQTIKNLYAAGATVNVNGTTQGDLYAAGGVVTVNGAVESDLVVAGGNLNLNGVVGGDMRAAGGNISISSPVAGDLLVAGGNISITAKATVGADLIAAGGNLVVDSEVKGKTKLTGGNITVNGKINGNLEVIADEQLTFGPTSEVVGKITYKGNKEAVVKEGAKVGTIEFTKIQRRGHGVKAFMALGTLIKFLALLAAGWVLHYFFRHKIYSVVERSRYNALNSLGLGFVVFVVSPILAVLLCATLIGFIVGLAVLLTYILTLLLACVLTSFYVGNLVYSWYDKNAYSNWKRDLILGTVVLIVVGLIPFIGWLLVFVAYLITLGSLVHLYKMKKEQLLG